MTENNYEFTNQIYDQNITSKMSNTITRDIEDNIYNLNDINKICRFLIYAGVEDHRSLSDKWDIYVTCNADMDSDPSELYSRFMNELYQQYTNKKEDIIYSGYDSDFEMDNRITYSTIQPIECNSFCDTNHNNYWTTDIINNTLPPTVNNTANNNIIDIISNAMNEVKIGIENKLVKKNTKRQPNLPSIWKHESDSIEV